MTCNGDPTKYFDIAKRYMNDVEAGVYPDEQMVLVEKIINYCLGKIEDIHPEQTQEPCFEDESASSPKSTNNRVIEDPFGQPSCSDKEDYLRYEEECDNLTIV